jgi:glycosyl transferase family 25
MEQIDAILYINLAHRADRNEHLLAELRRAGFPSEKIHRVDAVRHENGALGCGLSHIKTLETIQSHPEWKRVLVLEDDFTFKESISVDAIHWSLKELLDHEPDRTDICLLSYNPGFFRYEAVDGKPWMVRVLYSQTTSSYLISQHYVSTLLQNMRESTSDMAKNGRRHENCIDIHWSLLQPQGRWFAIQPAIGYQYANFSDIEGRATAYGC